METQNQSSTPVPSPSSGSHKTLMGVLSYLGILVIIPLLTEAKNDPFVKFHAKQGLVLLVCEVALTLIGSFFWDLYMIINLINLAILVLAIMGIINVSKGQMKELPVVGQFSKYFNF